MKFVYATGGREKYFKAEGVGDCVTRAICNATGKDYKEVYDRLKEMAKRESTKRHAGHKRSSVRDGVFKETWKRYLKEIGWVHHSVTGIGNKAKRMTLTEKDLPEGNLIVQISRHLTNVKDHVIYDTYDCSVKEYYDEYGDLQVNNERCVYGYWTAPTAEEQKEQEELKKICAENKQKQKDAITATKAKIKVIEQAHSAKLQKLEKQIKKLQHEYKIEHNRMMREIKRAKEADAAEFCSSLLG